MEELAAQEDIIFDMEKQYNESIANDLGGVLRGWDGFVHPKKCIETLPKEVRKFCKTSVVGIDTSGCSYKY